MIQAEDIWQFLTEVEDPEIPVVNVIEMGIVRDVTYAQDKWVVSITPTYSGCPAMHAIEQDITELLSEKGLQHFEVKTILSPAWTTDWMTNEARMKLEAYGIAPPQKGSSDKALLMGKLRDVKCPRCKSYDTHMISQFGSTACKSLYKCESCLEPFDYFKCI
ncbi:MAG: phenylacetate-CoA oxygenase subunit PaaJ [Bacteroidetes bacterium]|jgi:ring-1,2-phenylacetyl-CoA epoxidase subunit PaaD|nr:phenylacetate-CoA oxygenase subunit PaaJ [Bacteroidota bacterium]